MEETGSCGEPDGFRCVTTWVRKNVTGSNIIKTTEQWAATERSESIQTRILQREIEQNKTQNPFILQTKIIFHLNIRHTTLYKNVCHVFWSETGRKLINQSYIPSFVMWAKIGTDSVRQDARELERESFQKRFDVCDFPEPQNRKTSIGPCTLSVTWLTFLTLTTYFCPL